MESYGEILEREGQRWEEMWRDREGQRWKEMWRDMIESLRSCPRGFISIWARILKTGILKYPLPIGKKERCSRLS